MLNKCIYSVLVALLWAMPAHATIFFDSDFEGCPSGTGNDFPDTLGTAGCDLWSDFGQEHIPQLSVTTETAFTGTKSVKLTSDTLPGGSVNPTYRPSIYKNFTSNVNHWFLRVVIKEMPGFVLPSTGATKIIRFRPTQTANDPNTTDGLGSYPIFWLYNYFNSWTINIEQPCDLLPGGYWVTSAAPRPGEWDTIEVEYQINTGGLANGLLRIWVNNVLVKENLNRRWVSDTVNGTSCPGNTSPYWHPSDWSTDNIQLYNQAGNGVRYFDRIAVGDARIGPVSGTTPPPVDTTNPNPPTNLTAQ